MKATAKIITKMRSTKKVLVDFSLINESVMSVWDDIVRQGGTIPIISDGESHTFIRNEDLTWSNVPTEDSGNHEVVLTSKQFAWLGG